ncbi:DUF5689 domain-containing protein [Maribacter sp. MAR_2009_72]|uniref:DUF5689 domain-containing protein n=1 Tax=Maribacter sp. MAR_2009_72 TaxID=1250050 RepID=UPI001199E97A|nr:DUF5689 domain-containing protein [Maribacter sp. MAR_2009_72]TVZ15866.1 lamin tail-like protein [Maribacter sp. MAR_2009_72]
MCATKNKILNLLMASLVLLITGCVDDRDFDKLETFCNDEQYDTITIGELKAMFTGDTAQIQEDLIIEGYVTSSDQSGNFYNVLHIQDSRSNPTHGLQIELELRDSHLFFNVGQHIKVKLKGLYLGESNDLFKIGGVFTSFGNRSVGRLPKTVVFDHIFTSCKDNVGVEPTLVSLTNLSDNMLSTLVKLENVEFAENLIGEPFAISNEETTRTVMDCEDNEFGLLNSGYSTFHEQLIPAQSGTITGILTKKGNSFLLTVRNVEDINLMNDRCKDVIDEYSSNNVFISELADPNNNAGARFVELYHSSDNILSLKGWSLVRYTNANLTVSSSIDLSNYTIGAKSLLVISPNAEEFERVYGFTPDIIVGTNSPADSNGDDNIALVDPFGTIIDLYGVIGEDGSGTDHEFEDGRALRKPEINIANAQFNPQEWIIINDSGGSGTLNDPQIAPEDFTPGVR